MSNVALSVTERDTRLETPDMRLKTGGSLESHVSGLKSQGYDFFVHESAIVDEGAVIGSGTKIWHFCHVMSGAQIGQDCVLGQNVFVGGRAKIGDNVRIQNNVSVYDLVTLEDNVFCGPSMVFTNVMNPRAEVRRGIDEYRPTLVKHGATIGANATVVCGNTIGRYAFVGAGAVVTKDVPDYALVYGNATRIAGWMCECGEKLHFSSGNPHVDHGIAECSKCRRQYEKQQLVVKKMEQDEVTVDTCSAYWHMRIAKQESRA